MGRWFQLVGILASGMSLFSLAQKYWRFGLSPLMTDVVSYYRAIVHPIFGPIALWLGQYLPKLIADPDFLFAYAIGGSAACRLASKSFLRGAERAHRRAGVVSPTTAERMRLAVISVIVASPWMLLWPLGALVNLVCVTHPSIAGVLVDRDGVLAEGAEWVKQVLYVVFAFLAYFALNAYGPSL